MVALCMLKVSAVAPQYRADLRGDAGVVGVGGAEAAVLRGDAQRKQAGLLEVDEVLRGKARLAVVAHGAFGEEQAELADAANHLVAADRRGNLK